jgi:hypothetical protein
LHKSSQNLSASVASPGNRQASPIIATELMSFLADSNVPEPLRYGMIQPMLREKLLETFKLQSTEIPVCLNKRSASKIKTKGFVKDHTCEYCQSQVNLLRELCLLAALSSSSGYLSVSNFQVVVQPFHHQRTLPVVK